MQFDVLCVGGLMRVELHGLPEPQWFHHGVRILDLLDVHRPLVCVELGSNRGCSAIATTRLVRQWGGVLTCVDLWEAKGEFVSLDVFEKNVRDAGIDVQMLQMDTIKAAKRWNGSIDYLYVDADHSYEGCLADLEAWWPYLRVGGLVAGDDYDDPHGDPQKGVTAAWDDFERRHNQAFARVVSDELLGCQCDACRSSRLIWGVKR